SGMQKLANKLESTGPLEQKQLFTVFGLCSRWFQTQPIEISTMPLMRDYDRFAVLSAWQWPSLARLLLLMTLAYKNTKAEYIHYVKQLCNMADVNESIVLMQSLAFIPLAEEFVDKAREAARSNMASLFSAVAHQSNYASRYF